MSSLSLHRKPEFFFGDISVHPALYIENERYVCNEIRWANR